MVNGTLIVLQIGKVRNGEVKKRNGFLSMLTGFKMMAALGNTEFFDVA